MSVRSAWEEPNNFELEKSQSIVKVVCKPLLTSFLVTFSVGVTVITAFIILWIFVKYIVLLDEELLIDLFSGGITSETIATTTTNGT